MIVYKKVNDPEFERLLNEGTKESFNELREWLIFEENRIAKERKRMEYDEQFFDKKMAILKSGYEQLEIAPSRINSQKRCPNSLVSASAIRTTSKSLVALNSALLLPKEISQAAPPMSTY